MSPIKLYLAQTKPIVKRIQFLGFTILILGLLYVVIGSALGTSPIKQNQLAFLSITLITGISCLEIAPLFFPLDAIGSILIDSKELSITKNKETSIIPIKDIHTIYINIREYKGEIKDKWWIHKEILPFSNGQNNRIKFVAKGSIYENNFLLKKESEKESTAQEIEAFCLEKNIKLIKTKH